MTESLAQLRDFLSQMAAGPWVPEDPLDALLPALETTPLPEPIALLVGITAIAIALAGITWTDLRRHEIDPWLTALAVLAGGLLAELNGGLTDALAGALLGMGFALLVRLRRSAAIGEGDLYLYAMCGWLVGGGGFAVWGLFHAAGAVACTVCAALRRRRRIRRCTTPAALTACPSVAVVMLL